ncbi:hypothetical protein [Serratia marcescens]|nr:hypothetical protein [Serratia marcescens]
MLNNGQYVWRVTGADINNHRHAESSKGEMLFYSLIFIIGMLALGVVWS